MASNSRAFPRRPAPLLGASDGTREQDQERDQEHGNRGAAAAPLLILGPVVQRRRAGDKARSVARRMRASFPPVHGCAVGKPRRPAANPRAARARNVGSPFFGLLFFGDSKKSDSAAEGRRNVREPFAKEESRARIEQDAPTHDTRRSEESRPRRTPRRQVEASFPKRAFSIAQLARSPWASPPIGLPGRSASFQE
jgi:hypothetical protein